MKKQKLIIVVGPTASGKSALAVLLAKRFNGEIISTDSRQVYRRLDIGSGKVPGRWLTWKPRFQVGNGVSKLVFTYKGIPHHCIDFVSPRRVFTAAQFKSRAERTIRDIARRGKTPVVAGGTAFWIDALVHDLSLPEVKPDARLRRALEKKSVMELFRILKKLDPQRAAEIEEKNPRRLIRAIEIARALGSVPALKRKHPYETLWIGIRAPDRILASKIKTRLAARVRAGLIGEAKRLHSAGLSWKRFYELGLEYRALGLFLQGKISRKEMLRGLERDIARYAKRQMRWWKRNQEINWINDPRKAGRLVQAFLKRN